MIYYVRTYLINICNNSLLVQDFNIFCNCKLFFEYILIKLCYIIKF